MPTILYPSHTEGRCRLGNSGILEMASSPAGDPIPESQVYNAASYAKEDCDGF